MFNPFATPAFNPGVAFNATSAATLANDSLLNDLSPVLAALDKPSILILPVPAPTPTAPVTSN